MCGKVLPIRSNKHVLQSHALISDSHIDKVEVKDA